MPHTCPALRMPWRVGPATQKLAPQPVAALPSSFQSPCAHLVREAANQPAGTVVQVGLLGVQLGQGNVHPPADCRHRGQLIGLTRGRHWGCTQCWPGLPAGARRPAPALGDAASMHGSCAVHAPRVLAPCMCRLLAPPRSAASCGSSSSNAACRRRQGGIRAAAQGTDAAHEPCHHAVVLQSAPPPLVTAARRTLPAPAPRCARGSRRTAPCRPPPSASRRRAAPPRCAPVR